MSLQQNHRQCNIKIQLRSCSRRYLSTKTTKDEESTTHREKQDKYIKITCTFLDQGQVPMSTECMQWSWLLVSMSVRKNNPKERLLC